MSAFQIGQVIRGKYRIEHVLGEGGMGVVVAAQHVALDQRVAIKFLLPAMLAHREIVERFAREARAASKIQSDHVARVIDVDALEDGTPFMVMEYLEGGDLSSVRKKRTPLPVQAAAGYVLEACEAIGEAHRRGIVHRDIKPANLFLAQRGGGKTRVKVLDFGISKMDAAGTEPSVTRTSSVMGSAEYMSPEQMLATREVDARTDIWALGVTLYELVTACVPFPGQTITQVCAQVMSHSPAPPSTLWGEVPLAFDAVVMRCLEKDRNRRYQSIEELAAALTPFAAGAFSPGVSAARGPLPSAEPDCVSSPGGTMALGTDALIDVRAGTLPSNPPPPSMSSSYAPAAALLSAPATSTTDAVSRGGSHGIPSASRAPLYAIAAMMLFLFGGTAVFLATRSHPVAPSASVTAPASAPSPLPADVASAGAEPSAAPAVVPSAEVSAAPSASVSAPKKIHAEKPAAPPPPPVSKPNCKPPFTVDANGTKHAKPECL